MKLLLISLLIFSTLHALISDFKSDDYQIIIGEHFDDEAFDIVEDHDHTISVVGYSQHFSTDTPQYTGYHNAFDYLASINAKEGEQLRLISLDHSANISLDKSYSLSQYNRGVTVLKDPLNRYVLGGYTHNGQMLISSLETNGDKIYLHQFGTANFDQLHTLIPMHDGGNVAIGTSQTSRNHYDNMFDQGLGRSDVYLVRFDKQGQIQWKKKYGSVKKDIGNDGVATDDGGFIFIGISADHNSSELIAAKINDTGNTAWVKSFPKPGHNKAYKIIQTPQKDYLILAGFENRDGEHNIRLIKIDSEGNRLWEKNYYAGNIEQLNDIKMDLKGNIIGVGYSQKASSSDMDGLVRYFDHLGTPIWERHFGKERHDAFKTVSLLHDNTFAIAGFSNSYADKGRQIWILKLNDDGSMAKKRLKPYKELYTALQDDLIKTDTPVSITTPNSLALSDNMKHGNEATRSTDTIIHPSSPSASDISLFKDLRIVHDGLIFKQGSSTLNSHHKAVLDTFIPKLMRALQPYKHRIKNIKIKGHTSTEWNAPDTQRYLNNAQLSSDRAMSVLDYSYKIKTAKKYQKWMSEVFSTDGYSYADLVYDKDKEDKVHSRRVEFEIVLK